MEVWLIGTRAELDAAIAALTAVAYIVQAGDRQPLVGADAGRHRVFLRLALTPARRGVRPAGPASNSGGTVLPFPDRFTGGAA
ncbi:hypothetical protein ABUL04_30635 [Micromonospora harpali]|uniref:Acyl-CoA carboxylase epsilon subunit n=1 Tax=Micromonospora harpali TaxID=1490225 RepID=A0ABW1HKD8_9ACTN